mmetsp:Transcript_15185/g.52629  ORF Transcript_15185/g.52629 Transcript_15185/m.52629 type:complete len:310 (+) Transcript_15185:77-1006(+)
MSAMELDEQPEDATMAVAGAASSKKAKLEAKALARPWVEKYRPSSLDELVAHKDIISVLRRLIEADKLPHTLLYGPPGTGKTLLAECVASESRFAFFALSASALTSKWLGEGEKLVKALFKVARDRAPSVVFLDEVDSLLSRRGDGDHEASRRLKTEFLVHLDGLGGGGRVLFMGATNRPWDLDDAFLRRVPRRVLIPLPDGAARRAFLDALLDGEDGARTSLDAARREKVVAATEGYSMSDLRALAEEAAMGPLRALGDRVATARARDVRPVSLADFDAARRAIKPAADAALLARYDDWASQFGTRGN